MRLIVKAIFSNIKKSSDIPNCLIGNTRWGAHMASPHCYTPLDVFFCFTRTRMSVEGKNNTKIEVRELRWGRKSLQVVTVVMLIKQMEFSLLNSLMSINHSSLSLILAFSLCWRQPINWDHYKSTHKQRLGVNGRGKKQSPVRCQVRFL